jgi:hypothetical protein
MPRRKQSKPDSQVDTDDPLFRALRQVADEALEEEIPERLLRVIRGAHSRPEGGGEPGDRPPGQPSKGDETG